uniref:ORF68 n=1 Tax=Malaco herpesvirus 4 TaxID=3031800 RepID=A0AA48P7W5_9VIRU|nr:TPA_asm: ORF68 [Malaco herpesvirus 4]
MADNRPSYTSNRLQLIDFPVVDTRCPSSDIDVMKCSPTGLSCNCYEGNNVFLCGSSTVSCTTKLLCDEVMFPDTSPEFRPNISPPQSSLPKRKRVVAPINLVHKSVLYGDVTTNCGMCAGGGPFISKTQHDTLLKRLSNFIFKSDNKIAEENKKTKRLIVVLPVKAYATIFSSDVTRIVTSLSQKSSYITLPGIKHPVPSRVVVRSDRGDYIVIQCKGSGWYMDDLTGARFIDYFIHVYDSPYIFFNGHGPDDLVRLYVELITEIERDAGMKDPPAKVRSVFDSMANLLDVHKRYSGKTLCASDMSLGFHVNINYCLDDKMLSLQLIDKNGNHVGFGESPTSSGGALYVSAPLLPHGYSCHPYSVHGLIEQLQRKWERGINTSLYVLPHAVYNTLMRSLGTSVRLEYEGLRHTNITLTSKETGLPSDLRVNVMDACGVAGDSPCAVPYSHVFQHNTIFVNYADL